VNNTIIYLEGLRNGVFKLLPMREDYDFGASNHLDEYLINLTVSITGALECYPELSHERELAEVRANIAYLNRTPYVEFSRWRSVVLRSVRLISQVIERGTKEVTLCL
jgi:hypothetical protein